MLSMTPSKKRTILSSATRAALWARVRPHLWMRRRRTSSGNSGSRPANTSTSTAPGMTRRDVDSLHHRNIIKSGEKSDKLQPTRQYHLWVQPAFLKVQYFETWAAAGWVLERICSRWRSPYLSWKGFCRRNDQIPKSRWQLGRRIRESTSDERFRNRWLERWPMWQIKDSKMKSWSTSTTCKLRTLKS